MKILSNKEFKELVKKQSSTLKIMANELIENDPDGIVDTTVLDRLINRCAYCNDKESVTWLNNLKILATSGKLEKLLNQEVDWPLHALEVKALVKQGSIPYDIFTRLYFKDSGKSGQVVDYIPQDDVYLVLVSPYELRKYTSKELKDLTSTAVDDFE